MSFANDIGFEDRDGRICPFGGDALVVPGPTGDRCTIASVKRLTSAELHQLLPGRVNDEDLGDTDAANCSDIPED